MALSMKALSVKVTSATQFAGSVCLLLAPSIRTCITLPFLFTFFFLPPLHPLCPSLPSLGRCRPAGFDHSTGVGNREPRTEKLCWRPQEDKAGISNRREEGGERERENGGEGGWASDCEREREGYLLYAKMGKRIPDVHLSSASVILS